MRDVGNGERRAHSAEHRSQVQSAECRVQSAECRVQEQSAQDQAKRMFSAPIAARSEPVSGGCVRDPGARRLPAPVRLRCFAVTTAARRPNTAGYSPLPGSAILATPQ